MQRYWRAWQCMSGSFCTVQQSMALSSAVRRGTAAVILGERHAIWRSWRTCATLRCKSTHCAFRCHTACGAAARQPGHAGQSINDFAAKAAIWSKGCVTRSRSPTAGARSGVTERIKCVVKLARALNMESAVSKLQQAFSLH